MPRAFIVYSSKNHIPYILGILKVIDKVLKSLDIEPYYLSDQIRGGKLYPLVLRDMITQSDMGIVVLDGLRPNVTYEYGLLDMKNIDVIPLKKSDAKLTIRSMFYNPSKNKIDPELAFGDFYFKKAAFEKLKDPILNVNLHFSDCQGKHIVNFDTIDDTFEVNSLGNVLRAEIEKIIPKLRSMDGPDFGMVHTLFNDLNYDLLDESIKLLSLFSFIGWRQEFEGDSRFQSIREGFLSLFQNEQASFDEINRIFEALLENDEPILRKYGRYLTVDSDRLIKESFEDLLNEESRFQAFFSSIINSDVMELTTRFIERISTPDILDPQRKRSVGDFIFSRSGLFQDISVLQDRERSRLFSTAGYIFPSGALDLLSDWINSLSPSEMTEIFPSQSTLHLPGNLQDDILWFLNETSKFDSYFSQSMKLLFKFSLPVIVEEDRILLDIHSSIKRLALDRYLEQCQSLTGEVSLNTRWNYIKDLAWSEEWVEKYRNATKILKFRAITTFLQKSWSVIGPIRNGALQIMRTTITDGVSYDELENCRREAYQIIMEWLNQPVEYACIYESLFEYFYQNLHEGLKYIAWDQIKSLFEQIFQHDNKKILTFIGHIDLLRTFDNENWQGRYTEEQLILILQFQEELEENLSISDFFRRNMHLSIYDTRLTSVYPDQSERENYIDNLQNILMQKYLEMNESETLEITKLLLIKNYDKSHNFGTNLKNHLSSDQNKLKINLCFEIIERDSIETVSEFFLGLWNALLTTNATEWEHLLEDNWNNPYLQPYLYRLLWPPNSLINDFRWIKYLELVESRQIEPTQIINILLHSETPESVSIDDKILLLITAINQIGEEIASEGIYQVNYFLSFIWRLESLLSKYEDLLREDLAESFLEKMYPISEKILSQLPNTDILIKFGNLSRDSFKKWLKAGFQVSTQVRENFIVKYADDFLDDIYQITHHLFSISQENVEETEDYYISYRFKISGDPKILLKFTDDQIDSLFELNSAMLGCILGRLIQTSDIEEAFPESVKRLIIQHNEDTTFRDCIFQEFSSRVRVFVGNNYDQSFNGDYAKLSHWRNSATNDIFREWLQQLHHHIDAVREENRNMWRELEVE